MSASAGRIPKAARLERESWPLLLGLLVALVVLSASAASGATADAATCPGVSGACPYSSFSEIGAHAANVGYVDAGAPEGVAVDGSGNVYVASGNVQRLGIMEYSSTGTFENQLGGRAPISAPSALPEDYTTNGPSGVAVDSSGNVYATDDEQHRIIEFNHDSGDSSAGLVQAQWGTPGDGSASCQLSGPHAIAVAPDPANPDNLSPNRYMFVADTGNNRVVELATSTSKTTGSTTTYTCAQVRTWTTGYNDGSGAVSLMFPESIAVHGGTIYVSCNCGKPFGQNVQRLHVDGSAADTPLGTTPALGSAGPGQFPSVDGLAVASTGVVYIDAGQMVERYDSTAATPWTDYPVPSSAGGGLALSSDGATLYRGTGLAQVDEYNAATGSQVGVVGAPDHGQLRGPQGGSVDASGDLWVADTNMNRVQEFDASGGYLAAYGASLSACGADGTAGSTDTAGSPACGFTNPVGTAFDGTNVWVADIAGGGRLVEINTSGVVQKVVSLSSFGDPEAIAADSTNVYVSDLSGQVMALPLSATSTSGAAWTATLTGSQPTALGLASDGTDVFASVSNFNAGWTYSVQKLLVSNGTTNATGWSSASQLRGIAVDDTHAYTVSGGTSAAAITMSDKSGSGGAVSNPVTWGATDSAETDCPGTLSQPEGLAVRDGHLYAFDALHNTVSEFTLGGTGSGAPDCDTHTPAVTITSPSAGASAGSTPTITGTAGTTSTDEPTVHVMLYPSGGFPNATGATAPVASLSAAVSGGNWSVTPSSPLPAGGYLIVASQREGREGATLPAIPLGVVGAAQRQFTVSGTGGGTGGGGGAPTLSGIESSALAYPAGGSPQAVTSTLAVASASNLASATVGIASGYVSGEDELHFSDQNGITGAFNATTGVLTLTGSATAATYQAALRSVTYDDSSASPTTGTRTVSFQVSDGTNASNTASRDVTVSTQAAPVVSTGAVTTKTPISLTLVGSVNPEGADTHYYFKFGTSPDPSTWTNYAPASGSAPAPVDAGSGSSAVSVSQSANGLEPGTTYYFELVASNSGGTSTSTPVGSATTPQLSVAGDYRPAANIGLPSSEPQGVSAHYGKVAVADAALSRVLSMDTSANIVGPFWNDWNNSNTLNRPRDVEYVSGPGLEYLISDSDNHRVLRVLPTDASALNPPQFDTSAAGLGAFLPRQTASDASGRDVVVADQGDNSIDLYTWDGQFQQKLTGQAHQLLSAPQGVTYDPSGHIWAADTGNNRIVEIDPTLNDGHGSVVASFGTSGSGAGHLNTPTAIVADSLGNLWVADYGNSRVQQFDQNGNVHQIISTGAAGGSDYLAHDIGLGIDPAQADLYVADSGNSRVLRYTLPGPLAHTGQPTDLTQNSATLHGYVDLHGAEAECYFAVREVGATADSQQTGTEQCLSGNAAPSGSVTLTPGHSWQYRMVATRRDGSHESDGDWTPIPLVLPQAPPAPSGGGSSAPTGPHGLPNWQTLGGGVKFRPLGPAQNDTGMVPTPDFRPRLDPKTGKYAFWTPAAVQAQLLKEGLQLNIVTRHLNHAKSDSRLLGVELQGGLQYQDGRPGYVGNPHQAPVVMRQAEDGVVLDQTPLPPTSADKSAARGSIIAGPVDPHADPTMTLYVLDGRNDPLPPKQPNEPTCVFLRNPGGRPLQDLMNMSVVDAEGYLDRAVDAHGAGCKNHWIERKIPTPTAIQATVSTAAIENGRVVLNVFDPQPPAGDTAPAQDLPSLLAKQLRVTVVPVGSGFGDFNGPNLTLGAPDASGAFHFQGADNVQAIRVMVSEVGQGPVDGSNVYVSLYREFGDTLKPLDNRSRTPIVDRKLLAEVSSGITFHLLPTGGAEGRVVIRAEVVGSNSRTESIEQSYPINAPTCAPFVALDGVTYTGHCGSAYDVVKPKAAKASTASAAPDAHAAGNVVLDFLAGLWNKITGHSDPPAQAAQQITTAAKKNVYLCAVGDGSNKPTGYGPNPATATTAGAVMINNGQVTPGETPGVDTSQGAGCIIKNGRVSVNGIEVGPATDVSGKPVQFVVGSADGTFSLNDAPDVLEHVEYTFKDPQGKIIGAGGGNIIGAGAGNIIGAGGGNVIGAGGGNLVLVDDNTGQIIGAGGGNLQGAKHVNIIGAGGGNIIGAGGGNFAKFDVRDADSGNVLATMQTDPSTAFGAKMSQVIAAGGGNFTASGSSILAHVDYSFKNAQGQIIGAGGGNIIGAGGGNVVLVDDKTADIIGAGGGNVQGAKHLDIIGAGGGNIIGAGGGNFGTFALKDADTGNVLARLQTDPSSAFGAKIAGIIGAGGGNIIGAGGGNVIGAGGGNLTITAAAISSDANKALAISIRADAMESMVKNGQVIGAGGGNIIGAGGGNIIGAGGGNIIGAGGGNIIGAGGGNIIGAGGGNVIGAGGGN